MTIRDSIHAMGIGVELLDGLADLLESLGQIGDRHQAMMQSGQEPTGEDYKAVILILATGTGKLDARMKAMNVT